MAGRPAPAAESFQVRCVRDSSKTGSVRHWGEDDARADSGLSSEVVATHVRGLRDVGTANRGGGTYGVCVVLQTHGPWSLTAEVSCRANYALCAKSQL